MRYLTIAADYTGSAVRDDFGGPVEPEVLSLPETLCAALRAWNERYREIIPLDTDERAQQATLIEELDRRGQELATEIVAALGEAKVRYFSEGHLTYLT